MSFDTTLVGYCILVAAVAFFVGTFALRWATDFAYRAGFVDYPRSGEAQERPLPRTGGYAIFVAFMVALLVIVLLPIQRFPDEWPRLTGLALGCILIVPFALWDDKVRLSPLPQLLMQIGLGVLAYWFDIRIESVSNPFGGTLPVPDGVVLPLTVLWIAGMLNTVNFSDGVDGIAGGIGFIGAFTLFLVTISLGQFSVSLLPLALAAACLAFLRWNFYPSRIILGTSGAWLIGYTLAVLSILGGAKIATAIMVLGLPIADVATVIIYRLSKGRSPFQGGDAAHLHHRLLALGLTQRQVAGVFYILCTSFGLVAILLPHIRLYGLLIQAIVVAAILTFVITRRRNLSPKWQVRDPS